MLLRRTDLDVWGIPGGALELSETLEECGERQVLEETGCELGSLELLGVYSEPELAVRHPNGDEALWVTVTFDAKVVGEGRWCDRPESSGVGFFALDELRCCCRTGGWSPT